MGADRTFDLRVDDHPDPLKELRRLVRLQRAYAHANRGDELMTEKKVDAALEEYKAAARFAPEILELPFWHAVTLASIGREAEAAPIFKAVFAKEPIWADLLTRLPAAGPLPRRRGAHRADSGAAVGARLGVAGELEGARGDLPDT